jgi:hypothetical protein
MATLGGKTLCGASRGIGLAITLRLPGELRGDGIALNTLC